MATKVGAKGGILEVTEALFLLGWAQLAPCVTELHETQADTGLSWKLCLPGQD